MNSELHCFVEPRLTCLGALIILVAGNHFGLLRDSLAASLGPSVTMCSHCRQLYEFGTSRKKLDERVRILEEAIVEADNCNPVLHQSSLELTVATRS